MQGGGVRSAGERLAQRPVAQQLGELGEDLQVPLGRLLEQVRAAGVGIGDLVTEAPDLEDVFLSLTSEPEAA